jgi:hypothetical protein
VDLSTSAAGLTPAMGPGGGSGTPAHKSAYLASMVAALQQFDLDHTGLLPASVVRNCLVSGRDVKGVKPGVADVVLGLAPVPHTPVSLKDEKAVHAYGKLVSCKSEYAVDFRALLPLTYGPLVMLLRWAWLSRVATHRIDRMEVFDYLTWRELMVCQRGPYEPSPSTSDF